MSGSARRPRCRRSASAARSDHAPTLQETLDFVAGRVPIVVELKGIPGHDRGLVERVGDLLRTYPGKAAIMSFDHWLIRDFARYMPGIPGGLTAWGTATQEIEAHFSMLAHGISFVSYAVDHLPNRFAPSCASRLRHAGHQLDGARRGGGRADISRMPTR